jgi:rubrerythrin
MRSVNLADAVGFAIELEKSGKRFYGQCRENTRRDDVREIFAFLEREEQQHIALFERMMAAARKRGAGELSEDHVSALLDAYANSFFKGHEEAEEKAASVMDPAEAITLGLKIEKDAVRYYKRLKQVVPEEHRKTMERIIGTEKGHREKFDQMRDRLRHA